MKTTIKIIVLSVLLSSGLAGCAEGVAIPLPEKEPVASVWDLVRA